VQVAVKLGLIADIHGNKPALEAVLESAPRVDFWVCMGDVVGYYPDVNEVCEILIGINATVVRGNHDAYVLGQLPVDTGKMELYRTAWTRKRLKPEYCQWLSTLPVEMNLRLGQKEFKVRHASPWDEETYLYADSPVLSQIQLERDAYFLCGHTHHPLVTNAGEGYVVNPGSVGQPRDYSPGASYAVIDLKDGTIEHRRAAYDVASYQRYLSDLGWPDATTSILSRSR
jgi:putative phosphoesterase